MCNAEDFAGLLGRWTSFEVEQRCIVSTYEGEDAQGI